MERKYTLKNEFNLRFIALIICSVIVLYLFNQEFESYNIVYTVLIIVLILMGVSIKLIRYFHLKNHGQILYNVDFIVKKENNQYFIKGSFMHPLKGECQFINKKVLNKYKFEGATGQVNILIDTKHSKYYCILE